MDLPNPNSGTDAVTLKDGRHVLVYNHTTVRPDGKNGPRSPLNVAVSSDGRKWQAALVLEDEPREYSYPAIIQTRDGLVHITYTWRRQTIRHVVLDPGKLVLREIVAGPDNGFGGLYAGFDHSTTTNQGRAKIEGVEFNYMQQFAMLPRPLDRLQVFANLTSLRTQGQYASGADELAKFVPRTSNVGLSWQWRSFHVRVAQRNTSAFLDGYTANAYQRTRFRADHKIDLSFKYQLRRQLAVYFDVLNLRNKWPDQYTGNDQGRAQFSIVYGTKLNMGVNGRF
jgi:hypothetical protein